MQNLVEEDCIECEIGIERQVEAKSPCTSSSLSAGRPCSRARAMRNISGLLSRPGDMLGAVRQQVRPSCPVPVPISRRSPSRACMHHCVKRFGQVPRSTGASGLNAGCAAYPIPRHGGRNRPRLPWASRAALMAARCRLSSAAARGEADRRHSLPKSRATCAVAAPSRRCALDHRSRCLTKHPASLLAPLRQSGIAQDTDVARNTRLALAEDLCKLPDRELHVGQQPHDTQARRIGKRTQDIDLYTWRNHIKISLYHGKTYVFRMLSGTIFDDCVRVDQSYTHCARRQA